MKFFKLAKANKESRPKTFEGFYGDKVNKLIRKKYTISAELAILRQRDSKPEEFEVYNAYVEECKKAINTTIASLENT